MWLIPANAVYDFLNHLSAVDLVTLIAVAIAATTTLPCHWTNNIEIQENKSNNNKISFIEWNERIFYFIEN